jgi:hypothetical protein
LNDSSVWIRLLLAVLATWRVAHLLSREDGPADIIVRLRRRAGASALGRAMDCFQCASLWVAAPFALFVSDRPVEWLMSWLAASGAACLLERLTPEPVLIERVPEDHQGRLDDGMLRTETPPGGERTEVAGDPDQRTTTRA